MKLSAPFFFPLLCTALCAGPIWTGSGPNWKRGVYPLADRYSTKPEVALTQEEGTPALKIQFSGCKVYQGVSLPETAVPEGVAFVRFDLKILSGAGPDKLCLREWRNGKWEDFETRFQCEGDGWKTYRVPFSQFKFTSAVNYPDSNRKLDLDAPLIFSVLGSGKPGSFLLRNPAFEAAAVGTTPSPAPKQHLVWDGRIQSVRTVVDKHTAKPVYEPAGNGLKIHFSGCKVYQGIEFPPVRMPKNAVAVAFRIKQLSGEAPNELNLREWYRDGWEDFAARFQVAPDVWNEVEIPLNRFQFAGVVNRPDSNRKIDGDKQILFSIISRGGAGDFLLEDLRWIVNEPEKKTSRNLLRGDVDFETGAGDWLPTAMHPEGPVTVKGNAAIGEHSLLLTGDGTFLSGFTRDLIQPNRRYVLSFYARGTAGKRASLKVQALNYRLLGGRDFFLSDRWERYSATFATGSAVDTIHFLRAWAEPGGSMQLDAIQLEEGERATAFVPSEPLSVSPALAGASGGVLIRSSDAPELQITVKNNALPAGRFPLSLQLELRGNTLHVETLQPASQPVNIRIPCRFAREAGYYPTEVKIFDAGKRELLTRSFPFVIVDAPAAPPRRNWGLQMGRGTVPSAALRMIGINWLRRNSLTWDEIEKNGPVTWSETNPPRGKRLSGDFRQLGTVRRFDLVPAYARDNGTWAKNPADILNFLRYLIHVEGDRIDAFEMSNEPDVMLGRRKDKTPAEQAEYLCSILRAARPLLQTTGRPVVVNASGGRPGIDMIRYVAEHAPESFDVLAVHPYVFPRELADDGRFTATPEYGGSLDTLRECRAILDKYAPRLQMGIGELGWSLSDFSGYDSPAAHRQAAFLARTLLLSLCEPQLQWFIWFTMINMPEGGRFDYGIWRNDGGPKPLPAVAAYAQAIRAVGNTAGAAREILSGDIRLIRGDSENGSCFALWSVEPGTVPHPISLPAEVTATDLYGTPLASRELLPGDSPCYLFTSAADADSVEEKLKRQLEESAPLRLRLQPLSDRRLRLALHNRLNRSWNGTFRCGGGSGSVKLPPRGKCELQHAIHPLASPESGGTMEVSFQEESGKSFTISAPLPKCLPVVRRNLTDWRNYDFREERNLLVLDSRKDVFPPDPGIKWTGADDLSGKFFFCYDRSAFYVMAEIRDDEQNNPFSDDQIWRGDSIQLAFDPGNDAVPGRPGYDPDDYEYGASLGSRFWCWQSPLASPGAASGPEHEIRRDGDRTIYRLRFPWSTLAPLSPLPGRIFGFALAVKDRDGKNAQTTLCFGGEGIVNGKNPALFRKLILSRE